jgi:hypothetical protein
MRHDAPVEPDEQEDAVGDLARDLDGLGSGGGHQHGDVTAGHIAQASGRAAEVDGLAGEEGLDGADARAHLGKRRRRPSDRAR